ncbi:lipid IV(A) palmitoyltransferase PagP [Legionella sp. D16C41]|uniref:lipid IV(A) palmitoyltransferase PagP n=1 Tax=Legionella sp. D16C41 TaxID=3402688 RepID=UPI003AF993D6
MMTVTLIFYLTYGHAELAEHCMKQPYWLKSTCQRLYQIWEEGNNELYFSGYAWHNRYTYSPKRIKTYNEQAWGGGLGKGLYDEKGNWHGLSIIAFLDSHKNIEPALGYAYLKLIPVNNETQFGLGYSILITARPDIFHNIPFPGILPWASVSYRRLTLLATYIPGAQGAGNVLYIIGKWTLDSV